MARVNVYLPDDLARSAKDARVNISTVTQAALRHLLAGREVGAWLDRVSHLPSSDVAPEQVLAALDQAREDLER